MTLHNELLELRKQENEVTALILEKLQQMESTRGYLPMGYSSLFDYLVRGLKYSESTAYQRQACVKLSCEMPEIKEKLDSGQVTYSTLTMAFKTMKHKSTEEKRKVIAEIENKSARDVKKLLLEPAKPIKVHQHIYQDKVILKLELTHEQYKKLETLQKLKSHKHNMETLLESLIDKELKQYESKTDNKTHDINSLKPFPLNNPRYIPRRLRNAVLKNANRKCEYPGCEATHFLQLDHIQRVRHGGDSSQKNLQVLCAAHNQWKG
jgi:hypothetical protein